MYTEYEIAAMMEFKPVNEAVVAAKKDFLEKEAPMMDILDVDFLSLVLLTPSLGIALANGSISLFEELSLNKKARRFSKGGYFLKQDPVVHAMKLLINSFDTWEDKFYTVVNVVMESCFDRQAILNDITYTKEQTEFSFQRNLMNTPYFFVKALSSFFLPEDDEITEERRISKVEYAKVKDIGKRLKFNELPVFNEFCKTFKVK